MSFIFLFYWMDFFLFIAKSNCCFPFIDSSSIVSSTTIAGKIKNNGFSKDTAITIDDSSDDEVIVIDS